VIGDYVEVYDNHTIFTADGVIEELLAERTGTIIEAVQNALNNGELVEKF